MSIAPADFDFIRTFVRDESAIVLEHGKEYLVESRLSPVLRELALPSIAALVDALRKRPQTHVHRRVIEAMTTNETSFFRDISPFDALRTHIVPELMAARAPTRRLHIWCGAASTGQEPYSIAMVLLDHFPSLAGWDLRITATDISRQMIERARAGRYTQLEVNRGLPASYLVKYFQRDGMDWRIKDSVRQLVRFEELNLVRPWNLSLESDVIFLRNVLIYFDVATKRTILSAIKRVLRTDGYLMLGSAETTMNIDEEFARVQVGKTGCYRKAQAMKQAS